MIFRIHCNIFLRYGQVYLNFQLKQAAGKVSGINFNYPFRLHLVLVFRIYFDFFKYPEVQPARTLIK